MQMLANWKAYFASGKLSFLPFIVVSSASVGGGNTEGLQAQINIVHNKSGQQYFRLLTPFSILFIF